MTGRIKHRDTPVSFHTKRIRIPWQVGICLWCARMFGRFLWWVARKPVAVAAAVLPVSLWWLSLAHGWWPAAVVVLAAAGVLGSWWRVHPASFRKALKRLRPAGRQRSRYSWRWRKTMHATGLVNHLDGHYSEPALLQVRASRGTDKVTARMLPGQTVESWAKVGSSLAASFNARDARVEGVPGRLDQVQVTFLKKDPLTKAVPLFAPADKPDLAALPVGIKETGGRYKLKLLGNHILLIGATGAGKSSVIHAILSAVAPSIRSGHVRVWAIDPKRLELNSSRGLCARYAVTPAEIAGALADAVVMMHERGNVLAAQGLRCHVPTPAQPAVVILIDELAGFAHISERDLKRSIYDSQALLLTQGRACGITVIGCSQASTKEILTLRDLYPLRVCLRVTEADDVTLILGRGALDRGARADQIPQSLPGVAYVGVDGQRGYERVRFSHVTDEDIAARGREYAPPPPTPRRALAPVRDIQDIMPIEDVPA